MRPGIPRVISRHFWPNSCGRHFADPICFSKKETLAHHFHLVLYTSRTSQKSLETTKKPTRSWNRNRNFAIPFFVPLSMGASASLWKCFAHGYWMVSLCLARGTARHLSHFFFSIGHSEIAKAWVPSGKTWKHNIHIIYIPLRLYGGKREKKKKHVQSLKMPSSQELNLSSHTNRTRFSCLILQGPSKAKLVITAGEF